MKTGDTAYMIESNRIVREVTIVKVTGNSAIIRFENGGGTRIALDKLYNTEEKALSKVSVRKDDFVNSIDKRKYSEKWNGQLI